MGVWGDTQQDCEIFSSADMVLRRFLSISVLVIKRTERLKKIRIGHLGLEGLKFMGFLGQRVWGFMNRTFMVLDTT